MLNFLRDNVTKRISFYYCFLSTCPDLNIFSTSRNNRGVNNTYFKAFNNIRIILRNQQISSEEKDSVESGEPPHSPTYIFKFLLHINSHVVRL